MPHPFCRVAVICLLFALLAAPCAAFPPGKTRPIRPDVELVVAVAATGLGGLFEIVRDRDERLRLLRSFVASSRFFPERNGYFFVYDSEGICVAHGSTPELIGRALMEYEDENGFPVIRALVELGRGGGGFLEYLWDKPGSTGPHEKLGYVLPIPNTDFIIGSGLYLPEIDSY
ncbi:sodium:calcium antiporter [Pseudodesulfovibrio sp. F-1]|uniref:Sodium:calcium antiporter n=1 Tax=Pseudodesulfovibrio alkaliphilus TaxID=2661613 RepID=A0A7K1KKJ0_9BACT|nr:cache domain-containing protein [Pseudodesulfovibrio alkaliphilus]MUM76588.1 sodium:calcium antiporter [Pseudodesulfovibrio alkaliphilus]